MAPIILLHDLQHTLALLSLCAREQNEGAIVPDAIRKELSMIREQTTQQLKEYIASEENLTSKSILSVMQDTLKAPTPLPILWKEVVNECAILQGRLRFLQQYAFSALEPSRTYIDDSSEESLHSEDIEENADPIIDNSIAVSAPPKQIISRHLPHEDNPSKPIVLSISPDLLEVARNLKNTFEEITINVEEEFGFILPPFVIQELHDVTQKYGLHFRNHPIYEGSIDPTRSFALAPHGYESKTPMDTEPAYRKQGYWIPAGEEKPGFRLIEASLILESHIHEIVRQNIHLLFDWNAFNQIISKLELERNPLLKKLIPSIISRRQLFEIYTTLLAEDIPIHKHEVILKTIYAFRSRSLGPQVMTEQVRKHLFNYLRLEADYCYATMTKSLEKILRQGLILNDQKHYFRIEEPILERLIATITHLKNQCPVMLAIIVPIPLRAALQALLHPHRIMGLKIVTKADLVDIEFRHHYATLSLNDFTYHDPE